MAITREQIWSAADAIDATGQNPTLAAVRKAVGSGSFTTIQEAMTEWKASRAAKQMPISEPIPQAVADRLASFGAEVWMIAIDVATARLATEREALEASRAEADAARIETAELADQLTAELEEAKLRIVALTETDGASRAEIGQLRQQLAAAEARNNEIERHEVELRQATDIARDSAVTARERAAELAGKLEASERQIADLIALLGPKQTIG